EGWLSLNTDGASKGDIIVGCGGSLRNSDGLCLARNIGVTKVKVHVDSSDVIHTLNSSHDGSVVGWHLIEKIH
ncbi:hypothetical protein A2U01_0035642, partial [Trifolium medium]|nr:hypothetical protein [Trifolium medium]